MAKYTNDHFNKFIPEKDLQESISVENPVPLNLHPPRKMDEFMRDLIFEKRAGSIEVAADSNLVKLQQKLLDVMGPLSKVWTIVEKTSNSRFEQVEVSLPEILTNLDQTVMLLGQALNSISYTRRFNALKQITGDPRKTKQLLKEKNEIFPKETQFLFGEKFESDIIRTAKSKQKSKEVFSAMTNKQPPFRRGPLLEHQQNKGRGQNVKMVLSKNHSSQHTYGNQANNNT